MFELAHPIFLLLLIPIALWALATFRSRPGGAVQYSTLRFVRLAADPQASRILYLLPLLRTIALVLLVLGLARPRSGETTVELLSEGVDIIIALDSSLSMKAIDGTPESKVYNNRFGVAREVAKEFIQGRQADRIGLVVFGEEAFTQCPLTLDYGVLISFLDRAHIGMAGEGTALGSAIGVSTNRLRDLAKRRDRKEGEEDSRVIILVTDGRNTAGRIPPLEAARAAAAFDTRIYTIGIGSDQAYLPVDTRLGRSLVGQPLDLDEDTLEGIAEMTGGRYFRATDAEGLKKVYATIDALEKTEIETREHMDYTELYAYFLWPALLLLLIELTLSQTKLRTIP